MNTEIISNSTCCACVTYIVHKGSACVRYFVHRGDSKYTGSCDLNHMTKISDYYHHNLNRPTLLQLLLLLML